jgi:predicted nucleic acid-binding protein
LKIFLKTIDERIVVDTGIIYEILIGSKKGEIFQEMLFNQSDILEHWITTLNFSEIYYLICRVVSSEKLNGIIENFKNLFLISDLNALSILAGSLKCKYSISLPDAYSIALAQELNCKVIFKREKELTDNLEMIPSTVLTNIVFIDDFIYFKQRIKDFNLD